MFGSIYWKRYVFRPPATINGVLGSGPAMNAQSNNYAFSSIHIEKNPIPGDEPNYVVYKDTSKKEEVCHIREKQGSIDQKDVWHAEIFAIRPDGTICEDAIFGKDSYHWSVDDGVHMHIGPIDMSYIIQSGSSEAGFLGAWLAVALGLSGYAGVSLALAQTSDSRIKAYIHTNQNNSLDMYISNLNIALIPVKIAFPGRQPVFVRLGTSTVPIFL